MKSLPRQHLMVSSQALNLQHALYSTEPPTQSTHSGRGKHFKETNKGTKRKKARLGFQEQGAKKRVLQTSIGVSSGNFFFKPLAGQKGKDKIGLPPLWAFLFWFSFFDWLKVPSVSKNTWPTKQQTIRQKPKCKRGCHGCFCCLRADPAAEAPWPTSSPLHLSHSKWHVDVTWSAWAHVFFHTEGSKKKSTFFERGL